jgi:Alcohol dehydrogenase GroES-like domain
MRLGVDRGVWHLMTGLPYPIRLAGYGLRAPKNPVPGADLAGVVEVVGEKVRRFQPGDEVFGIGKGSYAQYAAENKVAAKPANLTFEQAAVVAISGLPALQGLRDRGRVEPNQQVLIIGASGRGGDIRRTDRQGVRRAGDRRVQHHEDRPGPIPRCRPRHRLHTRGLRGRPAALPSAASLGLACQRSLPTACSADAERTRPHHPPGTDPARPLPGGRGEGSVAHPARRPRGPRQFQDDFERLLVYCLAQRPDKE